MNNNQLKFDPMTGMPINQTANINNMPSSANTTNMNSNTNITNVNTTNTVPANAQPTQNTTIPVQNQELNQNNISTQIQSIPTVDQSKQEFINNTQSISSEKKEDKKEGTNYTFIIILFVIIFASIFFLFPLLFKYI